MWKILGFCLFLITIPLLSAEQTNHILQTNTGQISSGLSSSNTFLQKTNIFLKTNFITNTNIITNSVITKQTQYYFPSYIDLKHPKKPIVRSCLYPGLGQILINEKMKGFTLLTLFSASLITSFTYYFIADYNYNVSQTIWAKAQNEPNYIEREKIIQESYTKYDNYTLSLAYSRAFILSAFCVYAYNILDIYLSMKNWQSLSFKFDSTAIFFSYTKKL